MAVRSGGARSGFVLSNFVASNRDEIISRIARELRHHSPDRSDTDLLDSLPTFVDELIVDLRSGIEGYDQRPMLQTPAVHGQQRERLAFDITHLVHDYGMVCDAISSLADEHGEPIEARDGRKLNLLIDTGIAEAIARYWQCSGERQKRQVTTHIAFAVHELRN